MDAFQPRSADWPLRKQHLREEYGSRCSSHPKATQRSATVHYILWSRPSLAQRRASYVTATHYITQLEVSHAHQALPSPARVKAPPLSFAARTGDLLYISGIPGFDENRELPTRSRRQPAKLNPSQDIIFFNSVCRSFTCGRHPASQGKRPFWSDQTIWRQGNAIRDGA
jgi:hypothetical protein